MGKRERERYREGDEGGREIEEKEELRDSEKERKRKKELAWERERS